MSGGLLPGFADPERAAQRVFRVVLDAMARPGSIGRVAGPPALPPGLRPAAAAILLTLADADTPVWTDAGDAATAWLAFHTGCACVTEPDGAFFAHAHRAPPPLPLLRQGSAAAPQLSATLILEVASLRAGGGWRLAGPGIDGEARLAVDGLPARFLAELAENAARYPSGVDVLLCAGDRIAALPRTTRVAAG